MMYRINYIKVNSTWLEEETKDAIITCLDGALECCSECEFNKSNIIGVLTEYIKNNPFTNQEMCDFISYQDIDIQYLMSGEINFITFVKTMISDLYKDLIIDAKIYL